MAESADGRDHWLNSERVRVYPRLFLAVYALVIVGYALSLHDGLDMRGQLVGADFVTFYAAAKLVLGGNGLDAYNLETLSAQQHHLFPGFALGPYAWFYPPTFLLLIAPLALLPYLPALLFFVGGTAAAWVVVLRRAIGRTGAGWLIAAFPGLWVCAAHGQNGLLTAALAGGAILLLRRQPILAGVLIGLLAIKPQLAILFFVALIATKAWRTMLAAAATAAAFLGASLAVFGVGAIPAWVNSLQLARLATESGNLPWNKMPSTFAMLRQVGVPVDWSYAGHALVALAGVVAVWVVWRRADSLRLRGSVLMAGTFLVNPYSFDYDLVWLAFPIAWLACDGLERGWRRGDREVLTAAWVLPALATSIASLTHLQLAPFVLGAVVWIAARRVEMRPPAGFVRLRERWGGLGQRRGGLSERLRPGSRQPG